MEIYTPINMDAREFRKLIKREEALVVFYLTRNICDIKILENYCLSFYYACDSSFTLDWVQLRFHVNYTQIISSDFVLSIRLNRKQSNEFMAVYLEDGFKYNKEKQIWESQKINQLEL